MPSHTLICDHVETEEKRRKMSQELALPLQRLKRDERERYENNFHLGVTQMKDTGEKPFRERKQQKIEKFS